MLRGGPAAAASRTVDPARLRPTSRIFPDVAFTAFHNSAQCCFVQPWRIRPRFRLSQQNNQTRSSKLSLVSEFPLAIFVKGDSIGPRSKEFDDLLSDYKRTFR